LIREKASGPYIKASPRRGGRMSLAMLSLQIRGRGRELGEAQEGAEGADAELDNAAGARETASREGATRGRTQIPRGPPLQGQPGDGPRARRAGVSTTTQRSHRQVQSGPGSYVTPPFPHRHHRPPRRSLFLADFYYLRVNAVTGNAI
jgi:hypothetical protein